MRASTGWIFVVLLAGLQYSDSSSDTDPLFLSHYIQECKYFEAREKSKVEFFKAYKPNVTAYSGYITVDNSTNSNLFFLLTEVQGNSSSAPLLLWTQGGPGLSALFGLFLENGPVGFDINDTLHPQLYERMNTLQKEMSVLYLDLPVGAGFSFTNETTAYPRKLEDVVDHVMVFLEQFLEVFSEYKGREFYLAGESYGARYSVAIASRFISTKKDVNNSLSLRGIIGGNGFLGPILDTADSSSFLYQASMLTKEGHDEFAAQFALMKTLLSSDLNSTLGLLFQTIFTDLNKTNLTMFQRLTSYNDHASPLYTERPLRMLACFKFINETPYFKNAIHAGGAMIFQYNNPYLFRTFIGDWLRDITNLTQALLGKIDVLFYTGQLDALFPSVNQRAYYRNLSWTNAEAYRKAVRSPWIPYRGYQGFAGYIKKTTKFADAVLLGMSHYGAVDKPDEAYHLITQFISSSLKGNELFPPHIDVEDPRKPPQ